ncbi:MAG: hypothetical protein HQ463_03555, partial [Bacteroidetes bacterium]|nr:hypothetical protein [Bacteroidota bacterium]
VVADSGSTKTDWILVDKNRVPKSLSSIGLNPWHHSAETITNTVKGTFSEDDISMVTEVYFYGSGSSTDDKKKIVYHALKLVFKNANVNVEHDLIASAIACCGDAEGLACILGTGSNICHWTGTQIEEQVPFFGIGYILGDEASGCYLGKQLIRDFLYCSMPSEISNKLKEGGLTKDIIIEKVYSQKGANVYLASFTYFIYENKHESYITQLVLNSFDDFFKTHIIKFDKYQQIPVNFVGSIAFLFQDELNSIANKYGVTVQTIIKQPIDNLMAFHLNKL